MRDALVEALEFAAVDPDAAPVTLSGEGPSFSAGGDLDEFGHADDVGRAHAIRVLQSAARLWSGSLGERLTARLHGICVGAGIEVPAAAARVIARPGTCFRLPEVSMGLIPGAGGTVTIPRRIGRHRACYLAISGLELDLETALAWGLVDAVDDAAMSAGRRGDRRASPSDIARPARRSAGRSIVNEAEVADRSAFLEAEAAGPLVAQSQLPDGPGR